MENFSKQTERTESKRKSFEERVRNALKVVTVLSAMGSASPAFANEIKSFEKTLEEISDTHDALKYESKLDSYQVLSSDKNKSPVFSVIPETIFSDEPDNQSFQDGEDLFLSLFNANPNKIFVTRNNSELEAIAQELILEQRDSFSDNGAPEIGNWLRVDYYIVSTPKGIDLVNVESGEVEHFLSEEELQERMDSITAQTNE